MKKHKFIHSLAVVCCTLALLCLMPLSMVRAEENTYNISVYSSRPTGNNLSSIAQDRYCTYIYPNLSEYDFIGYYTIQHSWLDANTLLYGSATYSGTSWTFTGMAWNDNESQPQEITINRGFSWDNNGDYIYKYLAYENFDNTSVLNVCGSVPPTNPTIPPNLELPSTSMPNYTINNEQTHYIDTYGSPAISGGRISSLVVDYYNVYSVVQTAESDIFFSNRNDNYYSYQLKDGKYIFAVYNYSEIQLFEPNMCISNSYFDFVNYEYGDTTYVYVRSGIQNIQKDVNNFKMKYVDNIKKSVYGFDTLPFSNSQANQNHLEYLGTMSENDYYFISSASIELTLPIENSDILIYACLTDKYETIQIANNINNQTIIDSNMGQGFTNVDNQLKDMASTNDNGQFNQLGNELISSVENKATSLFYPVTWAIDTLNEMTNVEEKAVITLPALFKTNETYNIDFSVVENELPQLFTFIRSIIWIALAMLCINGVQNIIGGGGNDN